MGNGLTVWPTPPGGPTGQPIGTCLGGQIVLTELGQFSASSLTFAASDERAILAMQPYTILEVVQDGVGTLTLGYVLNPRQQITQQDEHTLTLEIQPLTVECTWRRLHRGWQAVSFIDVIASRLGSFTPGWTGVFLDGGTPSDIVVSETLNDQTPLQGFLNFGKDFDQYVRQGVDSTGAPTRVLEMGQMGAAPTVTLVSPKGGNADDMAGNPTIRLIATVDYQPNDVSSLVNVCTPFGGGSSTDTLVDLERLWSIINDPSYPEYGRYGSVADSIARTGKTSVFPEYDPAYPISDPDNPPTGTATFINGQLSQGAIGTRYFTEDGHSDYMVYDAASVALYGHKEGQFIDSGLTYGGDPSPANQELTERALYIETTTNFKKFAHPHHLFSCTTNDASSRPTRAGDLIALDYQRVSTGDDGAVVEMNVQDELRVMSVVRTFTVPSGNTETPPTDTYILSNLGRFDQTDAAGQPDAVTNMVALQISQGTRPAPFPIEARDNVDALHPLRTTLHIPVQLFRWQQCTFAVDFLPYAATAVTALNVAGTPIEFGVPHGSHDLTGTFAASNAGIPGVVDHFHGLPVGNASSSEAANVHIRVGDHLLRVNDGSIPGQINTSREISLAATEHGHSVPITGAPVTTAAELTATLPVHTHPLDQRIPDGPTAPSCSVTINGMSIPSGTALSSGTRNADGTFPGSFVLLDISTLLNSMIGSDLEVVITPNTGAGNPYGVGKFVLSGTWYGEFGGLAFTVHAT